MEKKRETPKPVKDDRQERLAAALRANLKKRKARGKEKTETGTEPPSQD